MNPTQPLRQAVIGVIGLGYVGLPLALLFEEASFKVVGFDTDAEKVRRLMNGESYIRHIGPDRVSSAFERGRISATTDSQKLRECDVIVICVPTPLGNHREPDLRFVRMTGEAIAAELRRGQLVVLESTTYPERREKNCSADLKRPG